MYFNGTIIITDPCYLIRENDGLTEDDWDYCNYGNDMDKLGIKTFIIGESNIGDTYYDILKNSKEYNEFYQKLDLLSDKYIELGKEQNSKYSLELEHYTESVIQYNNKVLLGKIEEIHSKLIEKYDVSLGSFGTDAGVIGVFLLDEVRLYNSYIDQWLEKNRDSFVKIENFTGDVNVLTTSFQVPKYDENRTPVIGEFSEEIEISLVGKGNVDFISFLSGAFSYKLQG